MTNVNQKAICRGDIKATCYDQSKLSRIARLCNSALERLEPIIGRKRVFSRYIFGPVKWSHEGKNVICNVGFAVLGELLAGTYGSTGEATHAALGSNSGAVSASDTTLGTETYRNAVASSAVAGNILYLTAYYNESETTGTYEEFGFFIDGTGSADSGEMWNHYLTGGWVKTGADVLVVDSKFAFTTA